MFDDENIDKMWEHGILQEQVRQVLDNRPAIVVNRRERRGLYVITGRDNGGACISVPIEPTSDPLVWRPITAWPCKDSEEARLK
ncbi:MAG: hypothetical protein IH959_01605 [Chloroflexi bacterium]|nr:hypothetical protein [Chloroflexota bacterium]